MNKHKVLLETRWGTECTRCEGTYDECVKHLEDYIDVIDIIVGNNKLDGVHLLYPDGHCASYVLFKDNPS